MMPCGRVIEIVFESCQVDIRSVALERASVILPEQRRGKCLAPSRQNLKSVALFCGKNYEKKKKKHHATQGRPGRAIEKNTSSPLLVW